MSPSAFSKSIERSFRTVALVIAAISSIAASAGAQGGSTGTVIGRVTGPARQQLVGAEVRVEGTSISTRTDQEGRYQLPLVPAGTARVTIRFLGYQSVTSGVPVERGRTSTHDVQLEQTVTSLANVVIEGQREGQARALTQQQNADNTKSVVSSDAIGRNPDVNSAEAIGRIPGVSITRDQGEGRFVSIRGTPQYYTNISVNGERLPGPDRNLRSVGLDAIMPDALAAIEVSKTLTPDMAGDAIGGTVNLVTKIADRDRLTRSGTLSFGQKPIRGGMIRSGGLTLGNRFGTDQKLGLLVGGSGQSVDYGSHDVEQEWTTATIAGVAKSVVSNFEPRYYTGTRQRSSFFGTGDLRYSPTGAIALRTTFNDFNDAEQRRRAYRIRSGTFREGDSVTNGRIENTLRDRELHQKIYSAVLSGNHGFSRITADYGAAWNFAQQRDLHRDEATFRQSSVNYKYNLSDPTIPQFTVTKGSLTNPALFLLNQYLSENLNTKDRDIVGRANFTMPYALSNWRGAFKFGGVYRTKHKESLWHSKVLTGFTGGTRLSLDSVTKTLDDADYFDGHYPMANPTVDEAKLADFLERYASRAVYDTIAAKVNAAPNTYDGTENVTAGYLMTTLDNGGLRIIPGVRIERTAVDLTGKKIAFRSGVFQGVEDITSKTDYTDVLPSVNVRYRIDNYTNVRAAVGRSIARPEYTDLRPFERPDFIDQQVILGNTGLKATSSTNYDVGVERFFRSIGLVSVNGFYKDVSKFIGTVAFRPTEGPYAGFLATQPQQGSDATVKGIELAWQQQLAFLPGALSGFGINANYTYAKTEATVPLATLTGTPRKAPFIGQVPHVANVALSYEKYGLQTRVAVTYRDTYLDTYGTTKELDFYTKKATNLDFSGNYEILRGIRIFAEASNLTNQPLVRYVTNASQPIQQEYYRWWGSAGIRWNPR